MSKLSWIAAIVVPAVCLVGCENPRVDDAHLLTTADEAQQVEQGFMMAQAGEVDLVEKVAAARNSYQETLNQLIAYYESTGNATKLKWARTEHSSLDRMAQYRYLMPAEWTPQGLVARDSIETADQLYESALSKHRYGSGLGLIPNNEMLRDALRIYNRIIVEYPTSDKIDDAAYRIGRLHEHFNDYALAAVYYQRAFQWNPEVPFPARFRAAYVMDIKLHKRDEALILYKQAIEKEAKWENNVEFAKIRIAKLTRLKPEVEDEVEVVDIEPAATVEEPK